MAELKGKQLSLTAKLGAIAYVVVMSALTSVFGWSVSVWDHIQVGIFIAAVFGPVDASLIAKAIRGGK